MARMPIERCKTFSITLARREDGSITVLGAVLITGLIGVASFAVELGSWYAARVQLQRIADMAAISGALTYGASANAQLAATAADNLARLNGAAGGASSNWNSPSATLVDGQVTASVVPSPKTSGSTAVKVTVTRPMKLLLTALLSSAGTVTLNASAWAEITQQPGSPACVLALSQTGTGLSIGGNPNLDLNGCTLRSNSDVSVFGSASVTTLGVYAGGVITGAPLITTTPAAGALYNSAGVVADPYAGDAALQNAFCQLGGGGTAISVSPHSAAQLTPGTYSSMDIKGTVTLQPGTYIVNGPVTFNAQATISGTGVTIISSNSFTINGGANINLSAPVSGASAGVPGVLMASTSSSASKINGGASTGFQGALYFPKSDIEFSGNSSGGGNGCLQVVANTVSFKGSANMGTNCANDGVATINSADNGVALVE